VLLSNFVTAVLVPSDQRRIVSWDKFDLSVIPHLQPHILAPRGNERTGRLLACSLAIGKAIFAASIFHHRLDRLIERQTFLLLPNVRNTSTPRSVSWQNPSRGQRAQSERHNH